MTTMATFTVNSDEVAASAARTTATGERIRAEAAAMMTDLLALQGSWGGVAAASFADCAAQWRATQAQVEASLEAIASQLAAAAGVYADAEAQSASLFSAR
jgi:WXG100 family type VII secretion target